MDEKLILKINNLYDIPHNGEIIEKDNPIATIICSNKDLDTAINDLNDLIHKNFVKKLKGEIWISNQYANQVSFVFIVPIDRLPVEEK